LQIDLLRGVYVTFINCGIGASTCERFAKLNSTHCVRFIDCNFEEANIGTDGSAFLFEQWDCLVIFDGCYIRRCANKDGATGTSLFRSNTGASRNLVKFYNCRFASNDTIDYDFFVANDDLTLQYSFDWRSFSDLTSHRPIACNLISRNDTLFAINEVPKLNDLPNVSIFSNQKFKGLEVIVDNGNRYIYESGTFKKVFFVTPIDYAGQYIYVLENGVLDWIPNPTIYNPLNLPDFTIRIKTTEAVTSADFNLGADGSLTPVDTDNNIYDILPVCKLARFIQCKFESEGSHWSQYQ
jgi:hypothetical protein